MTQKHDKDAGADHFEVATSETGRRDWIPVRNLQGKLICEVRQDNPLFMRVVQRGESCEINLLTYVLDYVVSVSVSVSGLEPEQADADKKVVG